MNIVICGLKGTGKTTLSKLVAEKFGFTYISDYDICKKKVNQKEIIEFIKNNDGYVFDLCYSLSPSVCFKLKNAICYFLGFISIEENLLLNLMKEKNEQVDLETIKQYKNKSILNFEECKKYQLSFFDINRDRQEIFNEILADIKNKLA